MSWSISYTGAKADAVVAVREQAKTSLTYIHAPESDDIIAARDRALELLALCSCERVKVMAHGSHSRDHRGLVSATFSVSVGPAPAGV